MKEIITWQDAYLFDYISEIEYLYVPDIDDYKYNMNISRGGQASESARKIETPAFGYSEIVTIFKDRYNNGKLHKQDKYFNYIQTVGHLLKDLQLDPDKFWCLFLFALDYCNSLYLEGKTMKATPLEELQALVDMINNADGEQILNFKSGKQKTFVESPTALKFLADAIQNQLNELEQSDIVKALYIRKEDTDAKSLKDSPIIVYFARIIFSFFDSQEQIKNKRKKGANYSIKEMELVSQLVYFSNLSTNNSWTNIVNETLKGFLKQYKDYEYPNNVSSIYPEFTVY